MKPFLIVCLLLIVIATVLILYRPSTKQSLPGSDKRTCGACA